MGQQKFFWTDELDKVIRDMALKSHSSSQVAEYINEHHPFPNHAVTRNSVIGRANRIGVHFSLKKVKPKKEKLPDGGVARPIRKQLCSIVDKFDAAHAGGKIDFWSLKTSSCRFGTGDGLDNIRFCGKKKRADSSYCEEHHKIVYIRPRNWG